MRWQWQGAQPVDKETLSLPEPASYSLEETRKGFVER